VVPLQHTGLLTLTSSKFEKTPELALGRPDIVPETRLII
jgi:hypothetical protein